MNASRRFVLALLSLPVMAVVGRILVPPEPPTTAVPGRKLLEAAPMCPWREPKADMAAFFPDGTSYRTETLILTSHLHELKTLLGRWPTPDENPLYLHRVLAGSRQIGSVLVRRVKGEYGAIEIVLAVKDGAVAGVKIQRMREPPPIAQALNSASWLQSFAGKSMNSSWKLNPNVPAIARRSASAVVEGAHALLVLHEVGIS